ncbi:MAG: four helix bundle protein [Phycisphaerales bacterium]
MSRWGGEQVKKLISSHRELEVWQRAFGASMAVFEASKSFPKAEQYSLTDQIRRSSRSVTVNITEAWRKRRYEAAFISKLNDAEAEAAETQDWIEYAVKCGYLQRPEGASLYKQYDDILRTLVGMIVHADTWVLPMSARESRARRE